MNLFFPHTLHFVIQTQLRVTASSDISTSLVKLYKYISTIGQEEKNLLSLNSLQWINIFIIELIIMVEMKNNNKY